MKRNSIQESSGLHMHEPGILVLADAWLPHAGGSRVYYNNLYQQLADHGHAVTVLTTKVKRAAEFDRAWNGSYRIVRRFEPTGSWKYYQVSNVIGPLLQTLSAVLRLRPQMLHACDIYPQGVVALLLKTIMGIPYIAFSHGEEITQMDRHRGERMLRNAVYRHASAIVAASEYAVAQLIRIGIPRDRITKINPGVNCARFTPGAPSPAVMTMYGLEGRRVLLTVARLVPRKGHASVLKAVARILPDMPDLRYVIAGTGPEESNLRRLVSELGIESAVRFAGYVEDDLLPDLYRAADVFVMPNSENEGDVEGFGMVFLEANAASKPVIAGRSGGTAESVEEDVTGFRIVPDDVDGLASLIGQLIADVDLRTRMGHAGLIRARRQFDWGPAGERFRHLCSRFVGLHSSARKQSQVQ